MRWALGRRQQLRDARVGEAVHTDGTTAPRRVAYPFDGIEAIGPFERERFKISGRVSASATVLADDGIPSRYVPGRMHVRLGHAPVATVWRPLHQSWHRVINIGAVDIRDEGHPVAHRYLDSRLVN